MERLTEKHYNGDGYYMKCSETCPYDCSEICDCEELDRIVDRLGAIEDILGDDYDLDRMRELLVNLRKVGVERPEGGMRKSNTKKPAFNADAAEEYFSDLLVCYRRTANDIFGRDNDGRHASEQIYSAEYQKYVGMQIAIREVLEYFSKYDLCEWITEVPDERLRELVQSDRDGRCVVLPCKLHDKVFFIENGCVKETEVDAFHNWTSGSWKISTHTDRMFDHWKGYEIDFTGIGKTVFLTREAAEAALKGENHGG